MRDRWLAVLLATLLALGPTACGASREDRDPLVVSAASSLTEPFEAYAGALGGTVRLSFAGSDELAAQMRQGVTPDVYAAADTRLPERLYAEGLVGRPVRFATNELVLAVPARGGRVAGLSGLVEPGVTIAIGSASVPIGAYTREMLARLGPERAAPILANVRSEEPNAKGIVGKLTQGAVDAGFVYASDVAAADGALRGIRLPAALRPQVAYAAAVVTGAPHPARARAFVDGLLRREAQDALRAAGFGGPP